MHLLGGCLIVALLQCFHVNPQPVLPSGPPNQQTINVMEKFPSSIECHLPLDYYSVISVTLSKDDVPIAADNHTLIYRMNHTELEDHGKYLCTYKFINGSTFISTVFLQVIELPQFNSNSREEVVALLDENLGVTLDCSIRSVSYEITYEWKGPERKLPCSGATCSIHPNNTHPGFFYSCSLHHKELTLAHKLFYINRGTPFPAPILSYVEYKQEKVHVTYESAVDSFDNLPISTVLRCICGALKVVRTQSLYLGVFLLRNLPPNSTFFCRIHHVYLLGEGLAVLFNFSTDKTSYEIFFSDFSSRDRRIEVEVKKNPLSQPITITLVNSKNNETESIKIKNTKRKLQLGTSYFAFESYYNLYVSVLENGTEKIVSNVLQFHISSPEHDPPLKTRVVSSSPTSITLEWDTTTYVRKNIYKVQSSVCPPEGSTNFLPVQHGCRIQNHTVTKPPMSHRCVLVIGDLQPSTMYHIYLSQKPHEAHWFSRWTKRMEAMSGGKMIENIAVKFVKNTIKINWNIEKNAASKIRCIILEHIHSRWKGCRIHLDPSVLSVSLPFENIPPSSYLKLKVVSNLLTQTGEAIFDEERIILYGLGSSYGVGVVVFMVIVNAILLLCVTYYSVTRLASATLELNTHDSDSSVDTGEPKHIEES